MSLIGVFNLEDLREFTDFKKKPGKITFPIEQYILKEESPSALDKKLKCNLIRSHTM